MSPLIEQGKPSARVEKRRSVCILYYKITAALNCEQSFNMHGSLHTPTTMSSFSNPDSQARISTRLSLRWLPEVASETTDTLVLNVGEWYVDLRVDKKSGQIDWALAGQYLQQNITQQMPDKGTQTTLKKRIAELTFGEEKKKTAYIVFTHDIDSHYNFNVSAPCAFIQQPNGDDLETGSMPRPDLPGEPVTDYEELWRYLPPRRGSEGQGRGCISYVLESDDGVLGDGRHQLNKLFIARIGGQYLVLQQNVTHERRRISRGKWTVQVTGGDVSARREEWVDGRWEARYVLGPRGDELPSMNGELGGVGRNSEIRSGDKVSFGGSQYIVRAYEDLRSNLHRTSRI